MMLRGWLGYIAFAIIAWAFVIPPVLSRVIPATFWYQPGPLFVHDGVAGEPPVVVPTRTIRRNFLGFWSANVYRERDGVFVLHCHRETPEPFIYRVPEPGAPSPAPAAPAAPLDMNWWLEIPPNPECSWPAGAYRIVTRWEVRLPLGISPSVEVNSNVFTLYDPAALGAVDDLERRMRLVEMRR